jgi:hypothetical protein
VMRRAAGPRRTLAKWTPTSIRLSLRSYA